ncbi:MAG: SGNH/GDSL hydrolase family protein, partial [Clostridiales bacterium]|nr:SGNH/GDSL hydrolase family protein [Clostridiales bacterium]
MMKKKILTIVAITVLIASLAALIYAGNMFGYFNRGNSMEYSVENTDKTESPLKGKTIIFLGSSVTKGFASNGESFVDFMVKQDGIKAVKEAV